MNVEILLTEAEIAGEFVDALQARDLPEKFFYWFPLSVKRWRNLASDASYAELQNAWTAVGGRMKTLTSHFGEIIPVISYGAGDGSKDRLLLHAIQRTGKSVTYFPVDSSQALLETACAAAEDEDFTAVGIKADISSRMHIVLAADVAEAPRVFVMSGNTLGGFDPLDHVKNIASSMRPGDRLILDGELDGSESRQILESDSARDWAFAPLASIGLTGEDGRVRFEQKRDSRHPGLCMITKHFHAERDLRLNVSAQDISMARGERIFMNFRYLYTPEAFTWLLEAQGNLTIEEQIYSPDGRFVTAICSA